jgi:hypothetical protein
MYHSNGAPHLGAPLLFSRLQNSKKFKKIKKGLAMAHHYKVRHC